MSIFDLLLWKKLIGNATTTTIDAIDGSYTGSGQVFGIMGMYDDVTLTNPGTTYASLIDVSGKGYLFLCQVLKPVTTNSCIVRVQITLDGTAIATDVNLTSNSTAANEVLLVGQLQIPDTNAPHFLPPVFLPFNSSLKIELKYNTAPGASEDITGRVFAVYS